MDNIARTLAEAGLDFSDIVKVGAYIVDFADFAGFNEIYAARFTWRPYPARTTIRTDLVPGVNIEIDCVARLRVASG